MSTASSRRLDQSVEHSSPASSKSTETSRSSLVPSTTSQTASSASPSRLSPNGTSSPVPIISTASKKGLSTSSARDRLSSESTVSVLSSSSSPPKSPLSRLNISPSRDHPSPLGLSSSSRTSTTQSKRVLALEDDSERSSVSKDEAFLMTSEDDDISSPISGREGREGREGSTGSTGSFEVGVSNVPSSRYSPGGILLEDSSQSSSRASSSGRKSSSHRALPMIVESDGDTLDTVRSSSSSARTKKSRRGSSHRSSTTRTHFVHDMGYASESTAVMRDPHNHSMFISGGNESPIHGGRLGWSSNGSKTSSTTGPVPSIAGLGGSLSVVPTGRERSSTRSESPGSESFRSSSSSRRRTRSERRGFDAASTDSARTDPASEDPNDRSLEALLSERRHSPPSSPITVHQYSHGNGGHSPSPSAQSSPLSSSSNGVSLRKPADLHTSASHLGISKSGEPGKTSRKKSKRPSKHEMLQLHGVWAYEREGKMQIFGGTTSKIIGKLLDLLVTSPDRDHIYFLVHIFLHGARQFYNAAELLSVLLKYWDLKGEYPDPCGGNIDIVRSSIIFFLAAWFEKRFLVDFGSSDDSAKPALEKFIRKLAEQYAGPLAAKLKRYATQEQPIPSVIFIKPLMSSSSNKLSLLDVKPAVIAGQWTLLDMRNFQNVQLSEFYAPADERTEWNRMLTRGENLTKWLALSIVKETQLSHRTKALKRAIDLALKFLEHNNFHGLMCTWGAINTNAVHRLSKTFKKLPRSSQEILKSLEEKLSEANNFANLRWSIHKQRSLGSPLIPWFELVAKNRNILDEFDDVVIPHGDRVTIENRDTALFSFSKFAKFADQIEEFLACQHNNRLLDLHSTQTHTAEVIIQNWLRDLNPQGENELWQLSVQCEPLDSGTGDSVSGV